MLIIWRNYISFGQNYFSIPLLLKTFFSPWRRYKWKYPRGFDAQAYFETLVSNIVSRVLGALCRTVLILLGILAEVFILVMGAVVFTSWLFLPLLIVLGLVLYFQL